MRAYVIGNATIDESYSVASLPQPGESIRAKSVNRCLGGKGANQAIMLSRCGIDTTLITATANDTRGEEIQRLLTQEPLDLETIKTDIRDSDQSILLSRPDGENSVISTTACAEQIQLSSVAPLLSKAKPGDSLIMQGNLRYGATHDLLVFARDTGLRTVFNPSPVQMDFIHLWSLVDVLFLNAVEAKGLTGFAANDATQKLLKQGIGQAILTQGESGAWLANKTLSRFIPTEAVSAVDTAGAGDTFMSVAIASAQRRATDIDPIAIKHAQQAAAITISRYGTASAFPNREEFAALLATSD